MTAPNIQSFFDPVTNSVTHLVSDPVSQRGAIIDSVLDYNPRSGRTATTLADAVVDEVRRVGLTVDWILETHAHADHLSAATYLKGKLGGRIGIGREICTVQKTFKSLFNLKDLDTQGADFDVLFDDGESFAIGDIPVRVMHTPGHTPACLSYLMGDDVFVGDTLFMPDYGTARCDFPGGNAVTLFASIRKVLALPDHTRLHLCHDYPPAARKTPAWVCTVAEQRTGNIHVHDGVGEDDFVNRRNARDKTLDMPLLILPAIQVNLRAGKLPPCEDNGVSYLKIPLNLF